MGLFEICHDNNIFIYNIQYISILKQILAYHSKISILLKVYVVEKEIRATWDMMASLELEEIRVSLA